MGWHQSVFTYESVVRRIVSETSTHKFAFSMAEPFDASNSNSGNLFEQDDDFFIIESESDSVLRAGPSLLSPNRCFGTVYVSLFTKKQLSTLACQQKLEQFCSVFSDKIIEGVRFRAFSPLLTIKLLGFTRYSGSIQFSFEFIKE